MLISNFLSLKKKLGTHPSPRPLPFSKILWKTSFNISVISFLSIWKNSWLKPSKSGVFFGRKLLIIDSISLKYRAILFFIVSVLVSCVFQRFIKLHLNVKFICIKLFIVPSYLFFSKHCINVPLFIPDIVIWYFLVFSWTVSSLATELLLYKSSQKTNLALLIILVYISFILLFCSFLLTVFFLPAC